VELLGPQDRRPRTVRAEDDPFPSGRRRRSFGAWRKSERPRGQGSQREDARRVAVVELQALDGVGERCRRIARELQLPEGEDLACLRTTQLGLGAVRLALRPLRLSHRLLAQCGDDDEARGEHDD